jgi:cytochrome c biogenesis protein CcmG/thiol:disulfide interchange protein DsbE
VVLNFWNTGCVPCIREHETLNEVADAYRARGVEFLGIMASDNSATLAQFAAEYSPTAYPNLRDRDEVVSRSYNALGVPLHVVIDQVGNVAWWLIGGPVEKRVIAGVLDDVLAGKRPTAKTTAAYPQ